MTAPLRVVVDPALTEAEQCMAYVAQCIGMTIRSVLAGDFEEARDGADCAVSWRERAVDLLAGRKPLTWWGPDL